MRIGLAFVFIYAGIGSLSNPEAWIGYIPSFVSAIIPATTFLAIHGIVELLLAAAILFKLSPKITYGLASLMLLSIIVFYGINEVTFRDVGLFALATGLWVEAMRPATNSGV